MADGVVVLDKSPGWTSHNVVGKCRRIFGQRRIGHSGTLDPSATGVLLVGLGRATRLLRYLTDLRKTYTCEVVFGSTTTTLDADGEVTETFTMSVTSEQVAEAATAFVGDIKQVPPMVSAVKVDGKRLHELAREGKEVERAPRAVTVYRFELEATDDPLVYRAEVECSSGTYVRTLAADLGAALGGGAHLRSLRRTTIGSFTASDGVTVEELEKNANPHVLPAAEALRDYDSISVSNDQVRRIVQGKSIDDLAPADQEGPWRMLGPDGELVAMFERGPKGFRSAVVLAG